MFAAKLFLVLIFLSFLSGCSSEENRKTGKLLTNSTKNFHELFNQEKFEQIYSEADDKLKNKFTEQQFISYLEVVKNEVGEISIEPHVFIYSDLNDEVKRVFFERTEFSDSQIISTDKAKYTEEFYWIVRKRRSKNYFLRS